MKRIVVGMLAVCLLGSLTVLANEEKATAEKSVQAKPEVVLTDITATGKLAKHAAGFTVTEADGTVVKVMAQKAAKEGEAAVVDNDKIDKMLGKDVKVTGKGITKTSKDGKKSVSIKTVTSIEEAAAAPVAAPAAKTAPVAAPAAAAPAAETAPVAAPEAK